MANKKDKKKNAQTPKQSAQASSQHENHSQATKLPEATDRADSELDLPGEFKRINGYIEECTEVNDRIIKEFDQLKNQVEQHKVRESAAVKRKIDDELKRSTNREKDLLNLINQLKESYECNLKKLRNHHKKQITDMVNRHESEVQKWKSKIENIKPDKKDEKIKVDDASDNLCKKLQTANQDLSSKVDECKRLRGELKECSAKVTDLENKLNNEKKSCSTHLTEIERIKAEISTKESALGSKDEEIKKLKHQIEESSIKMNLKLKELDEAKRNEQKLKDKCAELEKTQQNPAAADSSETDSKAVQVEGDNSGGDIYAELMSTKVELATAQRDLKRKTEVASYLRNENKDLKAKVANFEEKLKEEEESRTSHLAEIERYRLDVNSKMSNLERKDEEIANLKCQMDENSKSMDLKLKELNEVKQNEKRWKDKCIEFEKKNHALLIEIECIKRKNAALRVEIERKSAEIDNLSTEKNKLAQSHEALKKISKELESQVSNFSQRFTDVSSAKKSLQKQKCTISEEMNSLRNDLNAAKETNIRLTKERDEILSKLANKDCELKALLNDEKFKYSQLQCEYELEQDKVKRLEDRVSWFQTNLEECEAQLEQYNLDRSLVNEQLSSIKEEAAKHITTISMLEKKNLELLEELDFKNDEERTLREEMEMLKDYLEAKEEEMIRDKVTFEERFAQQMKLIDYLTKTADGSAKKWPSIFTTPTKLYSVNNEQKHTEIQRLLNNERQKNNTLKEQLRRANSDLEIKLSEVAQLNTQIYDLKRQMVQIISQFGYVKPMHPISNPMPHHFEPFNIKFSTVCMACAKQIFFGKKAKRCRDCECIVHDTCRVMNNCALATDTMRKVLRENPVDGSLPSSSSSSSMTEFSGSDHAEHAAPDLSSFEDANSKELEMELERLYKLNGLSPITKDNHKPEEYSFSNSFMDMFKKGSK